MSSSVVSFEEKLASVVKMAAIEFDGEKFTLTPRTNEGYKILQLRKGYHYINDNIVSLVDNAFKKQVSTVHVSRKETVN